MPDKGFKTVTVTEQLYEKIKQRSKKENKSVATFVSESMEIILYMEDNFANSNYAPFLELMQVGDSEIILRDNKKDHQIVGVRVKAADNRKILFYCELDRRDDCPHAAFAAALPQVRNAIRR